MSFLWNWQIGLNVYSYLDIKSVYSSRLICSGTQLVIDSVFDLLVTNESDFFLPQEDLISSWVAALRGLAKQYRKGPANGKERIDDTSEIARRNIRARIQKYIELPQAQKALYEDRITKLQDRTRCAQIVLAHQGSQEFLNRNDVKLTIVVVSEVIMETPPSKSYETIDGSWKMTIVGPQIFEVTRRICKSPVHVVYPETVIQHLQDIMLLPPIELGCSGVRVESQILGPPIEGNMLLHDSAYMKGLLMRFAVETQFVPYHLMPMTDFPILIEGNVMGMMAGSYSFVVERDHTHCKCGVHLQVTCDVSFGSLPLIFQGLLSIASKITQLVERDYRLAIEHQEFEGRGSLPDFRSALRELHDEQRTKQLLQKAVSVTFAEEELVERIAISDNEQIEMRFLSQQFNRLWMRICFNYCTEKERGKRETIIVDEQSSRREIVHHITVFVEDALAFITWKEVRWHVSTVEAETRKKIEMEYQAEYSSISSEFWFIMTDYYISLQQITKSRWEDAFCKESCSRDDLIWQWNWQMERLSEYHNREVEYIKRHEAVEHFVTVDPELVAPDGEYAYFTAEANIPSRLVVTNELLSHKMKVLDGETLAIIKQFEPRKMEYEQLLAKGFSHHHARHVCGVLDEEVVGRRSLQHDERQTRARIQESASVEWSELMMSRFGSVPSEELQALCFSTLRYLNKDSAAPFIQEQLREYSNSTRSSFAVKHHQRISAGGPLPLKERDKRLQGKPTPPAATSAIQSKYLADWKLNGVWDPLIKLPDSVSAVNHNNSSYSDFNWTIDGSGGVTFQCGPRAATAKSENLLFPDKRHSDRKLERTAGADTPSGSMRGVIHSTLTAAHKFGSFVYTPPIEYQLPASSQRKPFSSFSSPQHAAGQPRGSGLAMRQTITRS